MYWNQAGKANTQDTLQQAVKRAKDLGIEYIVVASNSGETAKGLYETGLKVVCVSHHVGFAGPGVDEMSPEQRQELQAKGIQVVTTTHLFAGVDRAIRNKFGGVYPAEIMAQTLRMFGQGVKVGIEIAGMALDAGLIPYGQDVVAVGGTGRGADSALVLRPAHSHQLFDTKIREIICKPREF